MSLSNIYNNSIDITVSGSLIDTTLSGFPLMIKLSSDSGLTDYNATNVFSELNNAEIDLYTKLLLEFDPDFSDTSASGHVVTVNGNVTIASGTAPLGYTNSADCPGSSGDYMLMPNVDDFWTNAQDFTVDCWIYPEAQSRGGIMGPNGYGLGMDFHFSGTRNINIWATSNGSAFDILTADASGNGTGSISIPLNTWSHVAFVRSGNNWMSFVNGVKDVDVTSSASTANTGSNTIGSWATGGIYEYNFNGKIANFRFSKGTARWTEDFLPPTSPYSSSYGNRQKIAIADDSDVQQYVEIEYWNHEDQTAVLWTRVPTLSGGSNTILHLYYDSSTTTNSGYVGDTLTTPAQNVWDDDYEVVFHTTQPPVSSDTVRDSTSNARHGDPNSLTSTSGVISRCFDFGNAVGWVNGIGSVPAGQQNTRQVLANVTTFANEQYLLDFGGDNNLIYVAGGNSQYRSYNPHVFGTSTATTDTWYHITASRDSGGTARVYYNGEEDDTNSVSAGTPGTMTIGGNVGGSYRARGMLEEVRVTTGARSAAWIKTDNYTIRDQLLSFSTGVPGTVFIFSNPIPVHLSKVYGTQHTLQLTTTISGEEASYVYDATFYNDDGDVQIGSTVSGVSSGSSASVIMSTPNGVTYSWYVEALSSGISDTSQTYSFDNRFLCAGYVEENGVRASGFPVRLYRRSNGELVDSDVTISGGTFSIDSIYNEYHYAVAIHPDDDETNALIYDWITP